MYSKTDGMTAASRSPLNGNHYPTAVVEAILGVCWYAFDVHFLLDTSDLLDQTTVDAFTKGPKHRLQH